MKAIISLYILLITSCVYSESQISLLSEFIEKIQKTFKSGTPQFSAISFDKVKGAVEENKIYDNMGKTIDQMASQAPCFSLLQLWG